MRYNNRRSLPVSLSVSLDFFLLLDRVAVGVVLGSLHNFVGKHFGDVLKVLEGAISGVLGDVVNRLVDSSEGRDIDGLSLDTSAGSDSGGVFSGSAVADGVDNNLDGVLAGLELNDLQSLSHDSHGLDLLTGVSAVEGNAAHDSLDNRAGGLLEGAELVASGSVGNEDAGLGGVDRDVVLKAGVGDGQAGVGPFAEKLGFSGEGTLKVFLTYSAQFP